MYALAGALIVGFSLFVWVWWKRRVPPIKEACLKYRPEGYDICTRELGHDGPCAHPYGTAE